MEDNRGLATLSSASPEVDTSDGTALHSVARGDNLGAARVGSNQVPQELKVLSVGVVAVEVGQVGS